MHIYIYELELDRQNLTGRTGQAEQKNRTGARTGRMGHAEQVRQNRKGQIERGMQEGTGRTGQADKTAKLNRPNWIGRTRLPGQDCQDTTARKEDRVARTGLPGQQTGLSGQGFQDKTARVRHSESQGRTPRIRQTG
jgi:hypothetical protein